MMFKIKQGDANGTYLLTYLLKYDAYTNDKWIHYGYSFERMTDTADISRTYADAVFATKKEAEGWIRGHGKPCVVVEA